MTVMMMINANRNSMYLLPNVILAPRTPYRQARFGFSLVQGTPLSPIIR